jgi:hypothetical protein
MTTPASHCHHCQAYRPCEPVQFVHGDALERVRLCPACVGQVLAILGPARPPPVASPSASASTGESVLAAARERLATRAEPPADLQPVRKLLEKRSP